MNDTTETITISPDTMRVSKGKHLICIHDVKARIECLR